MMLSFDHISLTLFMSWCLTIRPIIGTKDLDYNCSSRLQFYTDIYYYGDLINITDDVSTANECTKLCDSNEKCLSVNYYSAIFRCELMNGTNNPEINPQFFSRTNSSVFINVKCVQRNSSPFSDELDNKSRNKRQLISGVCGHASVSARNSIARIVGGFESKPNSFPWVVGLYQRNQQFCGGSLIHVGNNQKSDIVITAAHCVYGLSARYLSVKLGCSDLTQRSCVPIVADYVETHPQFNMILASHDIAIIKLQIPVSFNPFVQPICLPQPDDSSSKPGTVCTVAGWGSLYENGPASSHLMQVELPIIDMKICNSKSYYDGQLNPEVMLCAGYSEGKKDSCQGDSGGPLMTKRNDSYVLVGVVSFGQGCARPNYPGIYSKVDYFRSWLDKKIQTLSSLSRKING